MGKRYKPNPEYVKRTKAKTGSGDWWEPQKGQKNVFRVAPPWDAQGICIVRRVLHYGFEMEGRRRAFPCLADNEPWLPGQPCIVCHAGQKLMSGDKDERKIADDIKASSARYVVQGADVNASEKGIIRWAGPLSFGKYFLSLLEDEDIDDVTDPEEGYDLIIEISGKGRGTSYDYRLRPKSTSIPVEGWEDQLVDLIKLMEVMPNQTLLNLLEENYGNVLDMDDLTKDFKMEKGSSKEKTTKKGGKKPPTEVEIDEMTKKQLKTLIKDFELEIDPTEFEDLDDLRDEISAELEGKFGDLVPF